MPVNDGSTDFYMPLNLESLLKWFKSFKLCEDLFKINAYLSFVEG